MRGPKVSIIMSVYNAEKFVSETIDSILCQSFTDFEFLIVDDGSTDKTFKVISSFSDPRLKVRRNKINLGYIRNLNLLISLAKGEYIARQDADDISLPRRLEKQVRLLDKKSEIGVCGTNAVFFGEKRRKTSIPTNDADIKAYMIFRNPFIHSSVMIRGCILKEDKNLIYDSDYYPSEDYDLWFKISLEYKLVNLPNALLRIRWHDNNVSLLNEKIQINNANQIRHKAIECSLSFGMNEEEKRLHDLFSNSTNINVHDLMSLEKWNLKMQKLNKKNHYYSEKALQKIILTYWTKVCFSKNNIPLLKRAKIYFQSNIFSIPRFLNLISILNIKRILYNICLDH